MRCANCGMMYNKPPLTDEEKRQAIRSIIGDIHDVKIHEGPMSDEGMAKAYEDG